MLGEPRLTEHSVTITFARHMDIRRRVNELEDALGKGCPHGYMSPQLIPIPDEMGPDVPRVIFSSINGYSQIFISQTAISMLVSYSEDWQVQHERCVAYIRQRAVVLFDLLAALDAKPYYTGVSTRMRLISPGPDSHGVKAVAGLLQQVEHAEELNEANVRWSQTQEPNCFRNISIQSIRSWGPNASVLDRLKDIDAISTGVEISSDVNDRRGYNELADYCTSRDKCLTLINFGFEDTAMWAGRIGGSNVQRVATR